MVYTQLFIDLPPLVLPNFHETNDAEPTVSYSSLMTKKYQKDHALTCIQNVMKLYLFYFTVLTRNNDKQCSLRITGRTFHWEFEVPQLALLSAPLLVNYTVLGNIPR